MSSPTAKASSAKKRYQEMMATHEKEEKEREARRQARRLEDDLEQATATKRLKEEFDSFVANLEDDSETAEDQEPNQLLSGLPLKKDAVSDSVED